MKKIISSLLFISFLLVGCYKTDPAVLDLLKQIQGQNDALRLQVAAMQKTTDSLAIVFKANTNAIGAMDKKIDSIKSQLSVVLSQLNALNIQLSFANANIADIQLKIAELQKTCDQLLWMLNQCCNTVPASLQNGLVAYYPFTGNANDSSGNGLHGTVNGATNLTLNRFNQSNSAFYFPGNMSNKITVSHNNLLNFSSGFSISLWAYFQQSYTYHQEDLIYKGTTPFTSGWNLGLNQDNLNGVGNYNLLFNLTSGTGLQTANYCCFPFANFNSWHNYTVVYENLKLMLYFDGEIKNTISVTNPVLNNSFPIIIGGSINPVSSSYNRSIDDIRIYNRALIQSEITYLATH